MRQTIYDNRNRAVGYIMENSNTVQVYDSHNRLVGYYSKSADATYKNGNFFGRGDQTMRIIGS